MFSVPAPQPYRNPFRSSPSAPNVTGSNDSTPPAAAAETHLTPPPAFFSAPSTPPDGSDSSSSRRIPPERDLDGIPLEEPPPYTPSASVNTGETTVEHGPARPFQPPPPRPGANTNTNTNTGSSWSRVQSHFAPSSSSSTGGGGGGGNGWNSLSLTSGSTSSRSGGLLQQLTNGLNQVVQEINSSLSPQPTGASSSANGNGYPGQQYRFSPPPRPPPQSQSQSQSQSYRAPSGPPPPPQQQQSNNSSHPGLIPPPRHPLSTSTSSFPFHPPPNPPPPPPPPPQSSAPSSDFARDFYAAGTGDSERTPTSGFAPPPLPHRHRRTGSRSESSIGDRYNEPPSSSTSSNPSEIPNDGRPTIHPTVGHPLLNDGKLLVYPKGYECDKCNNTGYKHADPSKPCKKCWSKHAKPFAGPLAYSFSSPSSPSSLDATTSPTASNFQPPLPPTATAHINASASSAKLTKQHHHYRHHRNQSQSQPPQPTTPAQFAPGGYLSDQHGGFFSPPHPPPTGLGPLPRGFNGMSNQPQSYSGPSPAPTPGQGSVVYTAGDPRIGGRLCWRCEGRGNVSFLLLDRVMCGSCGGVGRVFD